MPPTCWRSSSTSWPPRSSRATVPASCLSSPPRRPRPRCSSTCSSRARRSTEPRGSRPRGWWWPRTRHSVSWLPRRASPSGAGGCFVAGGSAGNLSALMVARDTAAHRRHGDGTAAAPPCALSEDAHSSVGKALHVLGVDAVTVPSRDHRLTGDALRAVLERPPRGDDVIGVVATAGTTNAGLVDELDAVADVAGRARGCGSTSTPPTVAPPRSSPRRCVTSSAASTGPTRSSSTRTSGSSPPSTAPPSSTASPTWPRPCTRRTPSTSRSSTPRSPEEWNPSDYAFHLTRGPAGCRCGSRWPSTAWTRIETPSRPAWPSPSMPPNASAPRLTSSWCVSPGSPSCSSGGPVGSDADYDDWSARLLHDQIGFVTPDDLGGGGGGPLRLPAPRTPPSRWSTRSSTPCAPTELSRRPPPLRGRPRQQGVAPRCWQGR